MTALLALTGFFIFSAGVGFLDICNELRRFHRTTWATICGGTVLTVCALLFGDASELDPIFLLIVAIAGGVTGLSPRYFMRMEIGRIIDVFKRFEFNSLLQRH